MQRWPGLRVMCPWGVPSLTDNPSLSEVSMPRRTLRLLLAAIATVSLVSACTSPTAPNAGNAPTANASVIAGSGT